MPEQKDSEFTWKTFQEAHNNELVNNLSNFIHRVLSLTHKFYKGKITDFDPDESFEGVSGDELGGFHDAELIYLFDQIHVLNQHLREYDFRSALKALMDISTAGNQLLQNNEPWKIQKSMPETVEVVMNLSLQYVVALSIAMKPFLPFTSDKLRKMLNLPLLEEKGELLDILDKMAEGELLIQAGHQINEAQYLFSRIDDELIQKQMDKLHKTMENDKKAVVESSVNLKHHPLKETISYDDFAKIDLTTGTIIAGKN
jgi:methionyl-tRNA synthetase